MRPEQYPIVGEHLLAAIKQVLGEAATDDIISAWAQAYGNLADILMGMESALQEETSEKPGGWVGWRDFAVRSKQAESAAQQHPNFKVINFYNEPLPADQQGRDFDYPGLVDVALIADRMLMPDADYYICGPLPFMRIQHDALVASGIKDARIHYEVFGPDLFAE